MSFLGQAKKLMELQKQAKKLKKELSNIHIEAEQSGIKIVISGEQKVISVEIINKELLNSLDQLQKNLTEAFNKGISKSQEVAAENMKGIMGDLGLGGV